MKSTVSVARVTLVGLFLWTGCLGFSSSKPIGINSSRRKEQSPTSTFNKKTGLLHPNPQEENSRGRISRLKDSLSSDSNAGSISSTNERKLPTFVYRLNASTKWLVAVANTLGIWTRVHCYEGPFVVVGAILAVYFTEVLKEILNHDRPVGAPFADPGMPSSHSLVSFFMAAAWTTLVLQSSPIASGLVWASASSIAFLRVICGYHSYPQIGVGALLGSSMGLAWAKLGTSLSTHALVFRVSWCFYIMGSGLFIVKNMREWLHKEKHL